MKKETRNFLLNQVSFVLNECHNLVSQLSAVVLEEDQVCQDVHEEDKVCQEVYEGRSRSLSSSPL